MYPIYHNEISYYIGKRIKMILCKNINLTHIIIYINLQKTKLKVNLNFNICNKEYIYSQIFIIDKTIINITDNLIENIIQDFGTKYNL